MIILCFFFNDTATTEIYTLSLHDALPISEAGCSRPRRVSSFHIIVSIAAVSAASARAARRVALPRFRLPTSPGPVRSEEHTSELQSRQYLVCRLLLEKKNYN